MNYKRIVEVIKEEETPEDCYRCGEYWNAQNYVHLRIYPRFLMWTRLCDACLKELKKKDE